MAVQLARLSLWLATLAADKPLSFLDHHLQVGDSLLGAWLSSLRSAAEPVAVDRRPEVSLAALRRRPPLANASGRSAARPVHARVSRQTTRPNRSARKSGRLRHSMAGTRRFRNGSASPISGVHTGSPTAEPAGAFAVSARLPTRS